MHVQDLHLHFNLQIYIYVKVKQNSLEPMTFSIVLSNYWLHLVNCLTQFYGLFFRDKNGCDFFVENTSARYTFLEVMFQVDNT